MKKILLGFLFFILNIHAMENEKNNIIEKRLNITTREQIYDPKINDFAPCGATLYVGGKKGIQAFNTKSHKELKINLGDTDSQHTEPVTCLIASKNIIISGSQSSQIKINHLKKGTAITLDKHKGPISCLNFLPWGTQFVSSCKKDNRIHTWDLTYQKTTTTFEHEKPCSLFCIDKLLVVNNPYEELKFRDLGSNEEILKNLSKKIRARVITSISKNIFAAARAENNKIRIYDIRYEGKDPIQTIGTKNEYPTAMTMTNEEILAIGYYNGALKLWDPTTGNEIIEITNFHKYSPKEMTLKIATIKENIKERGASEELLSSMITPHKTHICKMFTDNGLLYTHGWDSVINTHMITEN